MELIFASAALGMCALAVPMLISRGRQTPVYIPLAGFLVVYATMPLQTVCTRVLPSLAYPALLMSVAVILLMWPLLWLYIEGLTAKALWRMERRHMIHLLPFPIGIFTATAMAFAEPDFINQMLIDEGEFIQTGPSLLIFLLLVIVVILLTAQAGFYLYFGIKRLLIYRRQVRDVFSSVEQRELSWIFVVFGLLVLIWCLGVIDIFIDAALLKSYLEEASNLAVVFVLASWGLRQSPGYEQAYLFKGRMSEGVDVGVDVDTTSSPSSRSIPASKYQKSALSKEQSRRIAGKLERLMKADKPYLNPELSLPMLANKVGVTRNFLSQTLNEELGCTFFDYINQYRIRESLDLLRKGDESVLDIAISVGFNSRSAFYKAFKKHIGLTPTLYQKQQKEGEN